MKFFASILLLCLCLRLSQAPITDPRVATILTLIPTQYWLDTEVKPGSGVTQCGGFWNTTGYVCKISELENFVKNEERNFNWIANQVYDARQIMQFIHERRSFFNFKLSPGEITSLEAYINKPPQTQTEMDRILKCLNFLQKIRNSALCSTCSYINYQFYFKMKIIIGIETCDTMITSCRDLMSDLMPHMAAGLGPMLNYAKGTSDMINGYREMLKTSPDSTIAGIIAKRMEGLPGTSYEKYNRFIKDGFYNALHYLNRLRKAETENNQAEIEKQKALLCITTMRINKFSTLPQLIFSVKEKVWHTLHEAFAIEDIKKYLATNPRSLGRHQDYSGNNWARSLQETFTDKLDGDSVIESATGAVYSVENGALVVQAISHGQKANDTLIFP